MKKLILAIFILVDLCIMAAAGFYLYLRITHHPSPALMAHTMPMMTSPVVTTPARVVATSSGPMTTPSNPSSGNSLLTPSPVATSAVPGVRHIAFKYRNSKAKKVDIKADFTQWKSEPMTNKNGEWTYQAALPPGEYEYCFIVDDSKGIRDPTNKRIKQIGTTYVSAVVVTALPPAKAK